MSSGTDQNGFASELKTINEELLLQNQFIHTILDASAHLIVVFDKDLRLTEANKSSEERFGLKKEQVLGKSYLEIFPGTEHTETYKDMLTALSGKYVHNDIRKSDIMPGYFENHFIPLFKEKEVYGIVVIAHDITQLVNTTERLKHSESFLQSVLNSTSNGIGIYKPLYENGSITDFIIVYTNQQASSAIGQEPASVTGKKCSEIYPGIFNDGVFEKLVHCIQTGEQMKYDVTHRHLGKTFWFNAIISRLEDSVIVTTTDITEEKKAKLELETAYEKLSIQNKLLESQNNELNSFSYIASHDLQEPLRKIRTFCGVIMDGNHDLPEQVKNYFSRIVKSAARMQNLIEALLSYSKTNSETAVKEKHDLKKVWNEVEENFQEEISEKKAVIKVNELPVTDIIHVQFVQLFSNLLSNALKYNKPGMPAEIEVTCSKVKDPEVVPPGHPEISEWWNISIKDNGIGFDPQYEEKIFQLFQRLHGRTEYEGTGIGLAICKKVMQNHNGFIVAKGTPGEGSVFSIYLPVFVI